jgi:hypothetical protein
VRQALYVRFEGTTLTPRGNYPGVFGLANVLARDGRLTPEQHRFWRANNDWYDANYTNPSTVDPTVYDPRINPGAAAWFKIESQQLVSRVDGYLELLAAHGVECRRLESSDPGTIIYEDEYQVVVVPRQDT